MPRTLPLLYLALTIFLLAGAAAFVFQSASAIRTHAEIDYGEGIVLWQAANVTNWKKAFRPIEEYPHIVFHYPPVFHLASRILAKFTGDLLRAGRLTSILSMAGTCLIAGLVTARILPPGGPRVARFLGGLTAGTLVFSTPLWSWSVLMRVDTLGIFLTICGVVLFVLSRERRVLAFLAFAFFVAAVYTKQTALAGPAACFLIALIEKPRLAVQLAALSIFVGLAFLYMLYAATDGVVLRHLITYNQNPYFPDQIPIRLKGHFSDLIGPAFFAALFPLVLLYRRKGRTLGLFGRLRFILSSSFERCVLIVAVYFFFTVLIVTATISKQGASDNYFLEADVAACLLSGLYLGWLVRRGSFHSRRGFVWLQIVVIAVLLVQTAVNWRTLPATAKALFNPPPDPSVKVIEFLKSLPDPVYSEDMVILMHAGKEVPAEPAIISALAADGKWDESGFVDRIRNGEFRAIVIRWSLTNHQRFSVPIARAIEERYYLTNEFEPFKVYLPK